MARIDVILEMLQTDPHDSFLLFGLAKEHEKLDQKDKALETYLKLKKEDPKYVGVYYHLGKLYEELDNKEEALKVYSQGIILTKGIKDLHALSELQSAKMNCEID